MKVFYIMSLAMLMMTTVIPAATAQEVAEDPTTQVSPVLSSDTEPEAAGNPETLRHKDRPISIMDQPLDGTSIEAFSGGIAKIDEEATEKDYRSLMSALDYLLFYDIGARRDKATLYSRLDGQSPNQIREMVTSARSKNKKKY